jgi:hypothetical protein
VARSEVLRDGSWVERRGSHGDGGRGGVKGGKGGKENAGKQEFVPVVALGGKCVRRQPRHCKGGVVNCD